MSTKRRANGSPSRTTRKTKPTGTARSAGAKPSATRAATKSAKDSRKATKPAARARPVGKTPAKAKVTAKTKATVRAGAGRVKPAVAANPARPRAVAEAATKVKSRQLAASTKSGIEVKAKPAGVSASKATTSAKPDPKQSTIVLPDNYVPSENEPFMSALQRHYFRLKLLSWKEDILRQARETLQGMHDDTLQYADIADRATSETDRALELRARDRQRKLIAKIDAALARIEDGTYGYCEETGEPIGLKRLDARPIATLSLEAQERHERRERVHRGD